MIYEPKLLRQRLHFTYVGIRLLSTIFDLYVIKHAGNINIMDETNDNQKQTNDSTAQTAPEIAKSF